MRKLNEAVDRFAYSHPRFGIPNLMRYIVIGNVIVYVLTVLSSAQATMFLAFNWSAVCHGEIWRLVTFIFVPGYTSIGDILWLAISLYFYYWIGNMLEREWGTAKFNLYYLSGVLLTLITAIITSFFVSGYYVTGADYVNMSMFFGFAMLYPDLRVLLFFFIPVKMKWLAWLDAAFFGLSILSNLLRLNFLGALLPLVAILNFFIFFWNRIMDFIQYKWGRTRYQHSPRTIHFKQAARRQAKQAQSQGYRHKCSVCGRTDTDYPDLQFRYCSQCVGYHCFCEDHIFQHVHFTE